MNQHTDRYWEGRWRDEKAHNDALVKALDRLSNCVFESGLTAETTEAWQKARLVLGAVGSAQGSGK